MGHSRSDYAEHIVWSGSTLFTTLQQFLDTLQAAKWICLNFKTWYSNEVVSEYIG